MAGLLDVLSLLFFIGIVGGSIYGVMYVIKAVSSGIESTKENLKKQGLEVSGSGVSIKTSRRFDRENYIDATQRGIVKALDSASFGHSGVNSSATSLPIERTESSQSGTSEGKRRKGRS
ncbi:hypothetical protein BDQ17DRAFT_1380486 [Cyathus striatus]|nr:hypothetical protein BDQ17DRAFT_1380486 [Cyathus striatus]